MYVLEAVEQIASRENDLDHGIGCSCPATDRPEQTIAGTFYCGVIHNGRITNGDDGRDVFSFEGRRRQFTALKKITARSAVDLLPSAVTDSLSVLSG